MEPSNPEVLCFYFNEEQRFKQCSDYTEIRIAELNVGASLADDFNCQFWINLNHSGEFDVRGGYPMECVGAFGATDLEMAACDKYRDFDSWQLIPRK